MNPAGLRQPDQRTCGATCVLVAADLTAASSGTAPPDRSTTWRADVVETHRRLTRHRLHGRLQLPWPRALGTPPWAVARELTALTGVRHRTRVLRWAHRDDVGPGALYVGDRWLPRHVLLVLDDDPLRGYNPATGRVLPLNGPGLTRWPTRWFAITPRSARRNPA